MVDKTEEIDKMDEIERKKRNDEIDEIENMAKNTKKEKKEKTEQKEKKEKKSKKTLITIIIMGILAIVLGIYNHMLDKSNNEIKETPIINKKSIKPAEKQMVDLTLYVPEDGFKKLGKVQMVIEYQPERERVVNAILLEYSRVLQERGDIDVGIVLQNSFFLGNDLYLNFQGSPIFKMEDKKLMYLAYSIANSIIDVGGVERVKFLVDNKEQKGILKEFYKKNTDI